MRVTLPALACVAVLLGAPLAQAAQRYAAPTGSGTACSQASPCSLPEAIAKAASNDEVIVGAGSYSVSAPLFPPAEATGVYIHGDLAAPMPKIVGATAGVPIGMTADSRVSYLEISNSGSLASAAICNPGGLIDRVRLMAVGEASTGLTINGNCTARDSLVRADGLASIAVFAYGYSPSTAIGTARNLTAIATGSQSTGILAKYNEEFVPGSYTLDLKNSIASGESSDLVARPSTGGPGNIVVTNSNYDVAQPEAPGTITGDSNQTAPPVFVDAANGDYREAAGSPTIDAGVADQTGTLDLEGNPRSLGAAPDIGAFEFDLQPPSVSIESLALSSKTFRAVNAGSAIISRKAQGTGRDDCQVQAIRGGDRQLQSRASGQGTQGRQEMHEADAVQSRPQEVHSVQEAQGRLHPRWCRGAKQLQVLGPSERQGPSTWALPARRELGRLDQTRRLQDRPLARGTRQYSCERDAAWRSTASWTRRSQRSA